MGTWEIYSLARARAGAQNKFPEGHTPGSQFFFFSVYGSAFTQVYLVEFFRLLKTSLLNNMGRIQACGKRGGVGRDR